MGDEPGRIVIVRHDQITPQWDIYKASQGGHMRWTQSYVLGPEEKPPFPNDPVATSAQVHVKLFSLAPYCIQPPHSHEEDIIFAVVRGTVRFLEGPEGTPNGAVGPLDVVYVPTGAFYGSINFTDELFQAYVIRLPREKEFRAPYNVEFPRPSDSGPILEVPQKG